MTTVVIPAAGRGQRFADAGYGVPKVLIPVAGRPMIERVIDNLSPTTEHQTIVVARKGHNLARGVSPDVAEFVHLGKETGGAIETILKARHFITEEPLLIGNCDQLADFEVDDFINSAYGRDGSLVTFKSNKPHHSYVKTVGKTIVSIQEKKVISNEAVTGIYYFKRGLDFVEAGEKVIAEDKRVKGEFYVSSAIDQMIRDGKLLTTFTAPTAILGTPEELQLFEMAVKVGKSL